MVLFAREFEKSGCKLILKLKMDESEKHSCIGGFKIRFESTEICQPVLKIRGKYSMKVKYTHLDVILLE